ncbi:12339_t:CDS:2 [Funneliformis caledonium]|uniref:12339_t:CDS:1 n=1 Tax=Funneliformis caledonium TaxID=1117310 RepID=A0A9N9FFD4_9GLOM|nr:12339_t:CDS:2 [Funneliformis caledonium]
MATFRLSVYGSKLYESLNLKEKINFVNELCNELATALPVASSRLVPKYRYQRDPTTKRLQVILLLEVISTTNTSDMNVVNIIKDLNSLIIHRDMGPLIFMEYTSLLDDNYGLIKVENFWIKYSFIIILFIAGILLVVLLCFIEQRKNPKAETAVAFKFFIGLVNYVLFIMFTIKYSKAAKGLYTASVTIILISTTFNETVAIFLISYYCRPWLKKHYLITTLFTLLSVVDIYSLMILSSKIGNHPNLSAKFSKCMHKWIFWVGLLAFVKKEIPQFVIMLIYYQKSLNLYLVPYLSLLILFIIIVFNAVWRLNQLFNFLLHPRSSSRGSQAEFFHNNDNENTGYETDKEDNAQDIK